MSRQLGHYIRRNIDGFQTLKPVVNSYYAGATRSVSASASNVSQDRVQSEPLVDDLNTVSDGMEGDTVTNSLLETHLEESPNQTASQRAPSRQDEVTGNHDVTINIEKTQVGSHPSRISKTKGQANNTDVSDAFNHPVSTNPSSSNTPIHAPLNTPSTPTRTRHDFTQQVAASILGETDANQSPSEQPVIEHASVERHIPNNKQDEQRIASNLHLLAEQRLRAEPAAHDLPNRDESPRHAGTDKPALRSVTNRHRADSPQPITVNVTIDQVSIIASKADSQTPSQAQRQTTTWKPDLTLSDYLRQRQDGER
ncbi:hypothetical protein A1OO_15335 [Enterovibrio norvegicus FF-33]|uniref:hypothetical protein n=1 Tax=Enterovibrio norvegicus TaxID=188144 RepID=UPI0002F8831E|nr:hypothetical protein [Enterovibrio norvegicus]OEE67128.1 hypothetical protein A1OO_15335 [Enterovibrio norvegicus FF-33]